MLFAAAWLASVPAAAQLPAFPGAEGFGAFASGGRSGDVYHVTNLSGNPATPGSLGYGLRWAPATGRTIVFDVSGNIALPPNSGLYQPNLTIAGQTAPGDGVAIIGGPFWIEKTNVIVRHLGFRNGVGADCLDLSSAAVNVMLDHVDTLLGTDENFSSFGSPPNLVTFQWSANAWGLYPHAMGALWDVDHVTAHHTLWAHHKSRDPKARPNGLLDWINNVTYDYAIGFIMGSSETPANWKANVEGCYFACPPGNLMRHILSRATLDRNGNYNFSTWMTNCLFDSDGDLLLDGRAATWADVQGDYRQMTNRIPATNGLPVTQDPPLVAYKKIVSAAGPLRLDARHDGPLRDELGRALMHSVLTWRRDAFTNIAQTGASAGGYGTRRSRPAPADTDRDGLPDYWEATLGGNPAADDHRAAVSANAFVPAGYTRLEEYLHFKAVPHASMDRATTNEPSTLDVDLHRYTMGFTNKLPVVYSISNVATGAVSLIGGYVARFAPPTNFSGRARFDFAVTDGDGSAWTQTFAVLVSAVPLPRDLTWRGDGATNTWDTNALSFVESSSGDAVAFRQQDTVTFDDNGDEVPPVLLTGVLQPGSVTFDHSTRDYTLTGAGALGGAATLTKRGAGRLIVLATLTNTGVTSLEGGTIVLGSPTSAVGQLGPGELVFSGGSILSNAWTTAAPTLFAPLTVPEGETGTVYTSRSLMLTGTLSGAGTLVLMNQAVTGNVQLAGLADTFEGTVRLVPAGTNPILQLLFAYGQFRGFPLGALELGATNTLRPVTMASGNTFPIGALTGATSAVLGGGARGGAITYSIGGLGRDDWFAGSIQAHAHLVKAGTGTLTLAGAAAHTGATTVAAGTLSLLGTCTVSRVTVATNAVLAGVGRIGGGLVAASNALLRPGGAGVGALTVSNGLAANATRWEFDLSADPTNSNDRFLLQGGVLALSNTQTLAFRLADGRLGAGTYALVAGGTGTVSANLSFVHNLPAGTRQGHALATAPGQLLLHVTNDLAALVWRGTNSGAWDHGTTNWLNAAAPDRFWRQDAVRFDDSATNGNVSVEDDVAPRSLVVSNAARAYTFSGPGAVTGETSLLKAGPGTLTLSPYASARAGVTVSNSPTVTTTNTAGLVAGLQVAGAGIPAGARIAAVVDGTTFTLSAGATLNGTNALTCYAAHAFTGATRVVEGVLALGNRQANATALGGSAVALDGGVLQLYGYAGSTGTDSGVFTNEVVVETRGTLRVPPRAVISNQLAGAGTLEVVTDYVRADFKGDWSAFTGRLNVQPRSGGAEFRVAAGTGFGTAALSLSNGITMYTTLADQTVIIGELAGATGAALGPGNGSAANPTWVVGGRHSSATFAGTLENAGVTRVVKEGAGAWTLTGSNTFSGGLVVSGGVLVVDNVAGSGTGTGEVEVLDGAGLAGRGVVAGPVTMEGDTELVPGVDGIGTLTLGSRLTLSAGSTTRVEIDKAAATSDVVACGGRVAFDGELVLTNLGGTLAVGDRFKIFSLASATGTFASISGPPARQAHWVFEPTSGVVTLVADFAPGTARYEARIDYTNYPFAEPLTNFPLLVRLGSRIADFDYNTFLTADGSDLRFRLDGTTNFLPHEIDVWNEAGDSLAWVQVPVFSNGCALIASWGDTAATNAPAYTTNGGAWTAGYVGVWHGRGTNLADATARGHDAFTNSATATAGLIGDAWSHDGLGQQARVAHHADFSRATNFEVQGWFNLPAAYKPSAGNYRVLTSKEAPTDFNSRNWWLALRSDGRLWWKSSDFIDVTNAQDLADGDWHHVAAIHAGAAARLYVDGIRVAEDATPGVADTPTAPVVFGSEDGTAGRFFKGLLDEWRISAVPRSSNWVWAVYHNGKDTPGFATCGAAAATLVPLPPAQFTARLTFPGYTPADPLTNIPLLVLLGTNLPGFSYDQFRSPGGADLRFTDAGYTTYLNHEVDTWNTAGTSRVWVQVPALSNGCAILAAWGSPDLHEPPACTTNGATWSEGYLGVWHLRETAGAHRDSSPALANSRLVSVSAQGVATGIVGGCDNFLAASSHYISLPDMRTNPAVTVEGWFYLTAPPGGTDIGLISSDPWSSGVTHFKISSTYQLKGEVNGGGNITSPTNQVSLSNWFHTAYTVAGAGGTDFRIYGNGGLIGAAGGRTNNDLSDVNIAREFNGRYLGARVDEVRISRVARSSNWLWAVHRNIASNGSFVAYGAVSNLFPNTAPALEPISNRTAAAGFWLVVTNTASDADLPAQALAFALVQAPTNATLGSTNGVFAWRPAVAQAGAEHTVRVAVTDSGWPTLGATQSFRVTVGPVGTASVSAVSSTNGQFAFGVAGDSGLDYVLEATADLVEWLPVAASNGAAPPLSITLPVDTQAVHRMYRLRLGP